MVAQKRVGTTIPAHGFSIDGCRTSVLHVQVRPLLDFEKKKQGAAECVTVVQPATVKLPPAYEFNYDRVYLPTAKEGSRHFFGEVVRPLLVKFLKGFNCTVRDILCLGHNAKDQRMCCVKYLQLFYWLAGDVSSQIFLLFLAKRGQTVPKMTSPNIAFPYRLC